MGRVLRLLLPCAALFSGSAAIACPNGDSEFLLTRSKSVAMVPEGAVQLLVDVPYDEEVLRSSRDGTVTLPVKKVLHGNFTEDSITFDYYNGNSCENFGPTGSDLYIVIYPLNYAEGDPVLNDKGMQEFDVIRYNWNIDPNQEGVLPPSFLDPYINLPERYSCFRRGAGEADALEVCGRADDPEKEYRTSWALLAWPVGLLLSLVGLLWFWRSRRKASK